MKGLTALLLALGAVLGLGKRVPLVSALGEGIGEGLRTVLRMFPPVAAILTAGAMLRASGALDALASLLGPGLEALGIPRETVALLLIRPLTWGMMQYVQNWLQPSWIFINARVLESLWIKEGLYMSS